MQLRLATLALPFALLVPSLGAQTVQTSSPAAQEVLPMPRAVRHAGTYHLASQSWTRTGQSSAAFGADVVYSNTAPSGYFSTAGTSGGFSPGSEVFEEGGLPGTTNGHVFAGTPDRDSYTINAVTIGYCDTGAPGSGGFTLNFYSSYVPCSFNPSPDGTLVITGLPANGGCWILDVDMTGNEVCLQADGGPVNPGWDDDPSMDSFGWSFQYSGTDGAPVGFLVAGNPSVTDASFVPGGIPMDGSDTYFGSSLCASVGTGYLTRDFRWNEDPNGVLSNCYFFGGYSNNNGSCMGPSNPFSSYHFRMFAESGPCDNNVGVVYCLSNPNTTGVNTKLEAIGKLDPALNDLTLRAYDLPNNVFGFFITSQTQGFVPNPAGSAGNLCLGGSIGRFVGPGQIMSSNSTGDMVLPTIGGLWSLDAIPTPTSSYAATAGITSSFQLWHRTGCCDGPMSNFSDAVSVTWQ